MTRRVDKPWGYELIWAQTDDYVGKILHLNEGEALSLQYHEIKDETIYVHSGRIELELEDDTGAIVKTVLEAGEGRHIAPGRRHRMTALADSDLLEVSTNHLDDVVRLEDRYGRVDPADDE